MLGLLLEKMEWGDGEEGADEGGFTDEEDELRREEMLEGGPVGLGEGRDGEDGGKSEHSTDVKAKDLHHFGDDNIKFRSQSFTKMCLP